MYKKILGIAVIAAVVVGGIMFFRSAKNSAQEEAVVVPQETVSDIVQQVVPASIERKATVYRSTTCGCCLGYIAELEKQGFAVEVKSLREEDMAPIKKQYGIPEDKQSCHTTVIGNYFIEGHVPIEAVEKLLTEKPDIDGIGLPGMPFGTPGMPGAKQAPYEIYEKTGDAFSKFMTL